MISFQILFKSVNSKKSQIIRFDEYKVLEMSYWLEMTNHNILSSK